MRLVGQVGIAVSVARTCHLRFRLRHGQVSEALRIGWSAGRNTMTPPGMASAKPPTPVVTAATAVESDPSRAAMARSAMPFDVKSAVTVETAVNNWPRMKVIWPRRGSERRDSNRAGLLPLLERPAWKPETA
jgi:hypothetical protein